MSITADSGPYVSWGVNPNSPNENPDAGPSILWAGMGVADGRIPFNYNPGQSAANGTYAWGASSAIMTLNVTPATLGVGAVAAAAHTVNGTAMTLVSASGAGIVISQSVTNALTGLAVTGLLAVGQAAGYVSYGSNAGIRLWDPTTLTARALSITCNSASGTGGAITIKGYDIYGYPMTETLTSVPGSALTVTGKKAWKYIASVTPAFSDATYTYSVDTTDIFGLPLASLYAGDIIINYPATLVTASTGYVAAVNTAATATTGDVRGTYALQSSSNGTNRLIVYQTPSLLALGLMNGVAGTSSGLFGVSQF